MSTVLTFLAPWQTVEAVEVVDSSRSSKLMVALQFWLLGQRLSYPPLSGSVQRLSLSAPQRPQILPSLCVRDGIGWKKYEHAATMW